MIAAVQKLRRLASGLPRRVGSDVLLRNSLYIMGTTVVNAVGGYLFWIVAARTHAAQDVGLAAALISAVTLVTILTNRGISGALVQSLAGRASGRAWSLALNGGLTAGALAALLAAVVAVLLLPAVTGQFAVLRHDPVFTAAFLVGAVFWTIADLLDAAYLAERQAGRVLARNAATTVCKNLFLLLLLPLGMSGAQVVFGAAMLGSGGGAIAGVLLVRGLQRGYQPALRGMTTQARGVLSQVLGHHVVIVGSMLPSYLLPVMVTVRLSAANTAYFYTTWMVGTIFFVISPAVSASLFVEGVHGTGRLSATAVASGRIIAGMLLPIMAVFLLGGPLILGLFGPNYAHHGESLLLALILSAVPDAITNVYVAVLRVQRRFREAATLNLGMAALVLVLAWFLLPVWGVAGAGWAWLIAQALGSVWVALRLGLARIRPETRTPLRQGAERSG